MTAKMETFCLEYLVDLNATQAAIRAGYSQDTAWSTGWENLRKPEIRARIAEMMDARSKRTLVDADFVVNNLIEVSQRCLQKVPVMEWNGELKAMAQKQDEAGNDVWEFDSQGANRALELLGKHLKMYTDKVEESGSKEMSITVKYDRKGNNPGGAPQQPTESTE
jgi:phage terminase small subunit